jgi:hypothetical protein
MNKSEQSDTMAEQARVVTTADALINGTAALEKHKAELHRLNDRLTNGR